MASSSFAPTRRALISTAPCGASKFHLPLLHLVGFQLMFIAREARKFGALVLVLLRIARGEDRLALRAE